jgi:hypothetical protein
MRTCRNSWCTRRCAAAGPGGPLHGRGQPRAAAGTANDPTNCTAKRGCAWDGVVRECVPEQFGYDIGTAHPLSFRYAWAGPGRLSPAPKGMQEKLARLDYLNKLITPQMLRTQRGTTKDVHKTQATHHGLVGGLATPARSWPTTRGLVSNKETPDGFVRGARAALVARRGTAREAMIASKIKPLAAIQQAVEASQSTLAAAEANVRGPRVPPCQPVPRLGASGDATEQSQAHGGAARPGEGETRRPLPPGGVCCRENVRRLEARAPPPPPNALRPTEQQLLLKQAPSQVLTVLKYVAMAGAAALGAYGLYAMLTSAVVAVGGSSALSSLLTMNTLKQGASAGLLLGGRGVPGSRRGTWSTQRDGWTGWGPRPR